MAQCVKFVPDLLLGTFTNRETVLSRAKKKRLVAYRMLHVINLKTHVAIDTVSTIDRLWLLTERCPHRFRR